ncbi:MAG: porin [Rhodopseudomonas sp.]|nr:porin [Rhodopseudomonas sp.]
MKMVKSLLLGTAAGLVAMTGAQAADLPVKAKPVQYVKICSLYGAGFYYIPGTDTCIKIGGWARAEYNLNAGGSFNPIKSSIFDRTTADNTIRARAMVTFDVRSQTEYGTLRSYIASGWNSTTTATTAVNSPASDGLYVPRAFIQLGGFTVGKAESFYDFYVTPAYSNTTIVWGSDTGGGGDFVLAYTAQLGNGLSATISAEDGQARQKGIIGDTYIAGPMLPDFVGNLRLDQAWGSAQIMGAVHQVAVRGTAAVGVPTAATHAGDTYGWAIGGGLKFNLPMLGKGDNISAEVNYAEGAIGYVGAGLGSFNISHGGTTGVGNASDAVVSADTIQLTKAWGVVAGYSHTWNANWKTSLYGAYGEVDYGSFSPANADWNYSQIGSRTVWTPVTNLDLSVDVMYQKLGTSQVTTANVATTTNSDQSAWQAIFRAQRNFWP